LIGQGVSFVGLPRGAPALATAQWEQDERTAFLGCNLSDTQQIVYLATLAASGHPGVVLLHSPGAEKHLKGFLETYRPRRVVPVGFPHESQSELDELLGVKTERVLTWKNGKPVALWDVLFKQAERVVVCPAEPRRLLLQAAGLAGALQAPLYLTGSKQREVEELQRRLTAWHTREVYVIANALPGSIVPKLSLGTSDSGVALPNLQVIRLANEHAVTACYLRQQLKRGPIDTLVVANPSDLRGDLGGMSSLAPLVTLQKRGVLLLTNDTGDNTAELVKEALSNPRLQQAESLILVAGLKAIPWERRPNPVTGKDALIEMEPLTPTGSEPFSFATGRLFHSDTGLALLTLARQRLLAESRGPRKALVVSNPAGGLPLLEAFSRNTAKEFRNAGYQTTALFENDVSREKVRRLLPGQDIFLWEGHHSTMVNDYGMPNWTEPLRPSLVFLQSCLALCQPEASPLLQRGAVAVVGSSTRTYSASGGAISLAFFDALLYEHQSLGGCLRHAKNFLLAYSLLKEKRLGESAKLQGANLRSAWAFTLWGDPTLKLPTPEVPADALPAVRHEVRGNTIVLYQPEESYEGVATGQYQARMFPNARLAGLLHKEEDSTKRHFVPFLFTEVHLPKGPPGKNPHLTSRVPAERWVFCWDPRRHSGYLLVTPRTKDREELRFHVQWETTGPAVSGE
jgi:hypothetical protein